MSGRPLRPLRTFRVPRYSLTANIVGVAVICLISLVVVAWRLHGSDLRETLVSSAVTCALLWAYFSVILYRGLRFDHGIVRWEKPKVEFSDVTDALQHADFSGAVPDIAGADGCVGLVIGAVLFLLALVVMVVVVYVGMEVGLLLFPLIALPLYGLFRLSARLVVVNAQRCRGRLLPALAIGLGYAAAYATVIGAVFYLVNAFFVKAAT